MRDADQAEQLISEYLKLPLNTPVPDDLTSLGPALLPFVRDRLLTDQPIDRTEAVESILKSVLNSLF